MKKYIFFIFFFGLIALSSCEDFLTEEYKSGANSETIVSTEANMEMLIVADYAPLRIWYGCENGWDFTEAGTDIYTYGYDNRSAGFCTYTNFVGEEQNRSAAVWYELYKALNSCNLGLANIDNITYEDSKVKAYRKGELSFLRAHYLWLLTETWGPTHFSPDPISDAQYEAFHTPINILYQQIFTDLDTALALTPETLVATDYGRISKPVVKAFLARTHLAWASYTKNGLEIKGESLIAKDNAESQEHYALAKSYAEDIINNYDYKLLNKWADIWNIDNIKNDEIIWAVNYSDNSQYTTANLMNPWDNGNAYNTQYIIQREGGNMGHLMWEIRPENFARGVVRDVNTGRGFLRWMPTKFFIDLYNESIDQRFFGSFKNVWYANDSSTAPVWKKFYYLDGIKTTVPAEKVKKRMFQPGDTAIYFSKTPVPSSKKAKMNLSDVFYFHPEKGYLIVDINDMYTASGAPNDSVVNRSYYFPITRKYMDSTRIAVATQYSKRDAYVMRLSEMYLIKAEAEMETGATDEAYTTILELANNRAVGNNGASLLSAYGVTSGINIDIDFILNERARELATENLRFFDLKRTGKLVERVRLYNSDASRNIQDFHNLRMIPQQELDAVYNPDVFTQNPGY